MILIHLIILSLHQSITINPSLIQSYPVTQGIITFTGTNVVISCVISNEEFIVLTLTKDGSFMKQQVTGNITGINNHLDKKWLFYKNNILQNGLATSGFVQLENSEFIIIKNKIPFITKSKKISLSHYVIDKYNSYYESGHNKEYKVFIWQQDDSYSALTKYLTIDGQLRVESLPLYMRQQDDHDSYFLGQIEEDPRFKLESNICNFFSMIVGGDLGRLFDFPAQAFYPSCDLIDFYFLLKSAIQEDFSRGVVIECDISSLNNFSTLAQAEQDIKNNHISESVTSVFYGFLENDDYETFSSILTNAMSKVISGFELINYVKIVATYSDTIRMFPSETILVGRDLDANHKRITLCKGNIFSKTSDYLKTIPSRIMSISLCVVAILLTI